MRFSIAHAVCVTAALTLAPVAVAAEAPKVEKVVVLMRHGVRPPTSTAEVTPFAAAPWPDFGVADGMLTPHGAEAAERLGAWERGWLAERGLFTGKKCPEAGDLFAWSSRALQRTTDTGDAFLRGMFPECGLKTGKSAGSGADPLFTATETDVGALNLKEGEKAILAAMGGSFDAPKAKLAGLMDSLQSVTQCCSVEVCRKGTGKDTCRIDELPWEIKPTSDKRGLKIEGPMSTAATISQIFLLEYGQGLPADKVAWGRAATREDVVRLSELRKIKYEYYERVPYLARRGSSNILAQIATVLTRDTGSGIGIALDGPPDATYTLYVGSDTQIAQIGGILDLHWASKDYLADETPPTGGLIFERLVDSAGARSVRVSFVTPTLDQIRSAAVLDAKAPPSVVPVPIPGCGPDGVCPAAAFAKLVGDRIDPSAVAPVEYR